MLNKMTEWVTRESGIVVPASSELQTDDGGISMSRRNFGAMALGVAGTLLVPQIVQAASLDDLVKHVERGQAVGYEGVLEGIRESDVKKLKDFIPQIVSLSKAGDGSTVLFFESSSKVFKLLRQETPTGASTPWIYTKEFGKAMGEWCLENIPNALVTFDFSIFNQAPSEHVIPCLQAMEAVFRLEWQKKGKHAEKARVLTLPICAELGKSWGIRSYYAHKNGDATNRDQFFEQAKPYLNELRFNENAFPNTDTLRSVGYIGLAANQFMRGDKDAGNKAVLDAADYFGPWIKKQYAEKQPEKWNTITGIAQRGAHKLNKTPEAVIQQSTSYLALKRVVDILARDFHFTSELVPVYDFVVRCEQEMIDLFEASTGFLSPEQLAGCKAKAVCYAAKRNFAILRVEKEGSEIVRAGGDFYDLTQPRADFVVFDVKKGRGKMNSSTYRYAPVDARLNQTITDYVPYVKSTAPLYAFVDAEGLTDELKDGAFQLEKKFLPKATRILA